MDPDHLPEADPSKMDFDKATTGAKAWKDIWGCGQGIGAVKAIVQLAPLYGDIRVGGRLDDGPCGRRLLGCADSLVGRAGYEGAAR